MFNRKSTLFKDLEFLGFDPIAIKEVLKTHKDFDSALEALNQNNFTRVQSELVRYGVPSYSAKRLSLRFQNVQESLNFYYEYGSISDSIERELKEMGFEEAHIRHCIRNLMSIEDSITYILSQGSIITPEEVDMESTSSIRRPLPTDIEISQYGTGSIRRIPIPPRLNQNHPIIPQVPPVPVGPPQFPRFPIPGNEFPQIRPLRFEEAKVPPMLNPTVTIINDSEVSISAPRRNNIGPPQVVNINRQSIGPNFEEAYENISLSQRRRSIVPNVPNLPPPPIEDNFLRMLLLLNAGDEDLHAIFLMRILSQMFQPEGISKENMEKLNKMPFQKTMNLNCETCVICYEDLEDNVEIILLPCKHPFHTECICTWLENSTKCPLCKAELNEE